MNTESTLWGLITKESKDGGSLYPSMTRIESGTTRAGIADIEYVSSRAHGWVEMKVGRIGRGEVLRLNHDFSADQFNWLIGHDNPSIGLRSYLLIGVEDAQGHWKSFVLLPARSSVGLIKGLKPVEFKDIVSKENVVISSRVANCLVHIANPEGITR